MSDVSVRLADTSDRPVLERLWLMFRHDMSEFGGVLPNPDGTFRSDRLHAAFTKADWAPYLVTSGESPVGLAFVRSLTAPTRVLSSFFVVRAVRRTGIGLRAVQEVVAKHPGPWQVAFQEGNVAAVQFWRRVATEIMRRRLDRGTQAGTRPTGRAARHLDLVRRPGEDLRLNMLLPALFLIVSRSSALRSGGPRHCEAGMYFP